MRKYYTLKNKLDLVFPVVISFSWLKGGGGDSKIISVSLTMLDSSSNGNFAFSWNQSCIIRSAQTSINSCFAML